MKKLIKNTKEVVNIIVFIVAFLLLAAVLLTQQLWTAFIELALYEGILEAWVDAWHGFTMGISVPKVIGVVITALLVLPVAKLVLGAYKRQKGGKKS